MRDSQQLQHPHNEHLQALFSFLPRLLISSFNFISYNFQAYIQEIKL